jgi:allantoinase
VDFALWGGLTPANLDRLEELAACGVIGFKAFMCQSGIDDFLSVEDRALREGMKRAAALCLPVAVHAESDAMTARLTQAATAAGRDTARDFLDSRPIEAELEAIGRALELAGETGCRLHVVHVSCAAGVRLIAEARARGVDATCETCPHYLVLTGEDVERLGPVAKCAPPLRSAQEQEALWGELLAGRILTAGSDHSPSPPGMKQSGDFFKVWGGISGAQHLLPLLLSRDADLSLIARLVSANVAERFQLPRSKGKLAPDCDADLALVKLGDDFEIKADDLFYRHRQSPYIGRRLRACVQRTLSRGRTIFDRGRIMGEPAGRLVCAERKSS